MAVTVIDNVGELVSKEACQRAAIKGDGSNIGRACLPA